MKNYWMESELKDLLKERRHEARVEKIGIIVTTILLTVVFGLLVVAFINGMEVLTY